MSPEVVLNLVRRLSSSLVVLAAFAASGAAAPDAPLPAEPEATIRARRPEDPAQAELLGLRNRRESVKTLREAKLQSAAGLERQAASGEGDVELAMRRARAERAMAERLERTIAHLDERIGTLERSLPPGDRGEAGEAVQREDAREGTSPETGSDANASVSGTSEAGR